MEALQRGQPLLVCVWSHLRDYRVRLNTVQREELADYFLPEMPSRFLERHVPTRAVHLARRQRRKAKTDVPTQIVHVLVALIERRKAAMHRLQTRYREVRDQIEAGTCEAPVTFEYDDVVADVNRERPESNRCTGSSGPCVSASPYGLRSPG